MKFSRLTVLAQIQDNPTAVDRSLVNRYDVVAKVMGNIISVTIAEKEPHTFQSGQIHKLS